MFWRRHDGIRPSGEGKKNVGSHREPLYYGKYEPRDPSDKITTTWQ